MILINVSVFWKMIAMYITFSRCYQKMLGLFKCLGNPWEKVFPAIPKISNDEYNKENKPTCFQRNKNIL